MLVKEILQDADLLAPNALNTEQKIRYFNQIQRQLYRNFPMPSQSLFLTTEPGISIYDISIQPERVTGVFIDNQEYTYVTLKDEDTGFSYSFLNNQLFIQPTPTSQLTGYILYDGEPINITVDNLEMEPNFLKDYHELFVLGIAQRIALIVQNYQAANEIEVRFQRLLTEAITAIKRVKVTKVRKVRGWS